MEERFAPGNLSCFFLPFRMADSSALEGLLAALQADSDGWAPVQDSLRYLLRHVADRLNGSSSTDRLCFRFSLTEHGRERAGLQPAERLYHTKPHTFHGGSTDFPCRLEGAELYIFRTTVCILSLQVSFQENAPLYVAAGQYYLKKVSREPLFDESGKELTLLDMGRRLVDGLSAGGAEFFFHAFPGTERANVLTRVETPLQENYSLELFHLRHCYHDGFLYTPEPEAAFYQPAQDTVWSVSTEAAACLVCPEQGRQEFLRGTFYRNFQQEYQFMYILLLHQKYVLYRFLALVGTKTGRDLDLLEDYREKLYSFETDYVFSCVTEVPQYQNLYEKLTDAFALKSMFEDVREPLIALREVRTEQAALDQKKRDARVNKGLLVLSLLTLFSALIDGFDFIGAFLPRLAPDAWVYNAQNGFVFLVFFAILCAILWIFTPGKQ